MEGAGWRELVSQVHGPPQVEQMLGGVPALGLPHTFLHPVPGPPIWI